MHLHCARNNFAHGSYMVLCIKQAGKPPQTGPEAQTTKCGREKSDTYHRVWAPICCQCCVITHLHIPVLSMYSSTIISHCCGATQYSLSTNTKSNGDLTVLASPATQALLTLFAVSHSLLSQLTILVGVGWL